jgi:hypothetical protein
MYTELYVKCSLRDDVPSNVIDTLQHMLDNTRPQPELPHHQLFCDATRWRFMLQCSSYYHLPIATIQLLHDGIGGWYLTGRSDLKNYSGEIDMFFDWIGPYCEYGGEFMGYSLYEEDADPVMYHVPEAA